METLGLWQTLFQPLRRHPLSPPRRHGCGRLRERMQAELALPIFSSDGLRLYFYAVTAHIGHWLVPNDGRKRALQIGPTSFMAR